MVMFESIGGLHPAGCDLDSHEVFGLFLFGRLGLRNLSRLILAQRWVTSGSSDPPSAANSHGNV